MSFFRHREIYQSDVEREPAAAPLGRRCRAHRADESPAGYSSAGCSPAEPASASPARLILQRQHPLAKKFPANGNLSLFSLSQERGSVYVLSPDWRSQANDVPQQHPCECRYRFSILILVLQLAGCYKSPSERTLATLFREHRSELVRLVRTADEDPQYRRLPDDGRKSGEISERRYREYNEAFQHLGLGGPMCRYSEYPATIFIYIGTWVTVREQPMSVAYVYSPKTSLPTVDALNIPSVSSSLLGRSTPCIAFVPLEEHWYLSFEVADKGQSGISPPCVSSVAKK